MNMNMNTNYKIRKYKMLYTISFIKRPFQPKHQNYKFMEILVVTEFNYKDLVGHFRGITPQIHKYFYLI